MESIKLLPIEKRPNNGEFKKNFEAGKYFEELYILLKNYHFALKESEKELLENTEFKNTILESEKMFPKYEREPFDLGEYSGVSKLKYYSFIKSLKRYHDALTLNEKTINKNGKEKINS